MAKRTIIVIDGVGKTAKEWCACHNLSYNTYKSRIHKGASPKEALNAVVMTKSQAARKGKSNSTWMDNFDLPRSHLTRLEESA